MATILTDAEIQHLKRQIPYIAEDLINVGGRPLRLERPWQFNLVGSPFPREVYGKGRQTGFSFSVATRSMLRAQYFPAKSYNAVFVSINREEAMEKIRYCYQMWECMPRAKRLELLTNNKLALEFTNGNRIESFPTRSVRGKPDVDLILDEFAHMKGAMSIYKGSTASTIRGDYGITIGSTPFGRGSFYEICAGAGNVKEFRNFRYRDVPWWISSVLCRDVETARIFAPGFTTEERVYRFGTDRLIEEFEGTDVETFQQEFEVNFVVSGNSVLSEDVLLNRTDGHMVWEGPDVDVDNPLLNPLELIKMHLDEMKRRIREERAGNGDLFDCFGGMDIGRTTNATEITILEYDGRHARTRFQVTLRRAPFQMQDAVLNLLMTQLPIRRLHIDQNGIGRDLTERAQLNYGELIIPMNFGVVSKALMANTMVRYFDTGTLTIYPTRRTLSQLMSVKKVVTEAGLVLYKSPQVKEDDEKGYKSHADIFWSMAMGLVSIDEYLKGYVETASRGPAINIWTPGQMGMWAPPNPLALVKSVEFVRGVR